MDAPSRVLVVDDERFFREAIRDALRAESIECVTAAGADEALERARDPAVAAVVLDVSLPDDGGMRVLARLREERPTLGVIILSAHLEQHLVLEALRQGACDYLAKPLHDEELVLAVRRALAGHGVRARWEALRERLRALEAQLAGLAEEPPPGAAGVGERAVRAAASLLGASKTSLLRLGEGGDELRVVAATGRELAPAEMDPVRVGEGVAGVALTAGGTLLVDDVEADPRFAGRGTQGRYRSRSLVAAPVERGDRAVGVLCATDRDDGLPFGPEDASLLRILALGLGSRLAADEARPTPQRTADAAASPGEGSGGDGDAELARRVCDALTTEIEPERLVRAALRAVAGSVPAAPVALYLVDPASGELVREGQWEGARHADRERLPAGSGLTGTVLATGRLIATDAPERDPRFDVRVDTPEGGGPGPLLCVPVRVRGRVLGVLRLFPMPGARASARTGEVLVAAISAAVRNVLMYRSLLESVEEVARVRRGAGKGAPAAPGSRRSEFGTP